jgi:hypothetical protein
MRGKLEKEIKSAVYKPEESGEFVSALSASKFLNKPVKGANQKVNLTVRKL